MFSLIFIQLFQKSPPLFFQLPFTQLAPRSVPVPLRREARLPVSTMRFHAVLARGRHSPCPARGPPERQREGGRAGGAELGSCRPPLLAHASVPALNSGCPCLRPCDCFLQRHVEGKAAYFKKILYKADTCPPISSGTAGGERRYPAHRRQRNRNNQSEANNSTLKRPRRC